jgi:ATP-dependent Clp protease adaptor protein ClpS
MSTVTLPDLGIDVEEETGSETKNKILPPYNVILVNDDDHSVDYVVLDICQKLFGMKPEQGVKIAETVHFTGRAILKTCSKELAELKQEQVHSVGPDKRIPRCKGSMTALIEPAY